jgi:hypothetical protein
MDCETFIAYLSDYIDNELDDDLSVDARAHLETCSNCSIVLDSTQKMILLYRDHGKQVIPAIRRQRLYDQIEAVFARKNN